MPTAQSLKSQKGFTLIELLVVIGILAILLAIVLIAINPARQFAQANNTKRNSDVQTLLNAIHQYAADNGGNLPAGLSTATPNVPFVIGDQSYMGYNGLSSANATLLCQQLVNKYLAAFPEDPGINNGANITEANCGLTYNTGYVASVSATNSRMTLSAPNAQLGAQIFLTR
jgi:type IV pilus assembly protein PilA